MKNDNKKVWALIQNQGDLLLNKLSHTQIIQKAETIMHIFAV